MGPGLCHGVDMDRLRLLVEQIHGVRVVSSRQRQRVARAQGEGFIAAVVTQCSIHVLEAPIEKHTSLARLLEDVANFLLLFDTYVDELQESGDSKFAKVVLHFIGLRQRFGLLH